MSFTLSEILLITAAATVGLSAGLLVAYAVSVNPGLRTVSDVAYLQAMQAINAAIQNAVFFAVYFGPLLLLPLCCWVAHRRGATTSFRLLVAAGIVYIFGVLAVTVAGNVPLNDRLTAFRIEGATIEGLHRQRLLFEGPWNRLHTIRTWAAVVSFLLVVAGLFSFGKVGKLPVKNSNDGGISNFRELVSKEGVHGKA